MYIKRMFSFLILFLGLPLLAIAGNKGYLVSSTAVDVSYIHCHDAKPHDCDKNEGTIQTIYIASPQKNQSIDMSGVDSIKIISLNANNRKYVYSDDLPCMLYKKGVIKFELYNDDTGNDDIMTCNLQPAATRQ